MRHEDVLEDQGIYCRQTRRNESRTCSGSVPNLAFARPLHRSLWIYAAMLLVRRCLTDTDRASSQGGSGRIRNRAACSIIIFLLIVSVFFVLVSIGLHARVVVAAAQDASPALQFGNGGTASTGSLAQCIGADVSKLLSHPTYKNCARFAEKIEEYAQKNGLIAEGVDMIQIFTVGMLESGCKLGEELNAAGQVGDGGFFQVDNPCLFKKSCQKPDLQFDEGTKELAQKVRKVKSAGFSGRDANLMYLLAYNRGLGVVDETASRIKSGMTLANAAQDVCASYYGYPDGKCGKIKCSNPKRFHCDAEAKNLCDYKFYCGVAHPDIGIHYADKGWKVFESMCTAAGGTIQAGKGPVPGSLVTPASMPLGEEAPASGAIAKRKHPLFSVPYSINPSFRASIPFDFNRYDTIARQMKKLSLCGVDVSCILGNVSLFEAESQGSLDWMVKFGGAVLTKETTGPLAGKSEIVKWEAFCEQENQNIVNSLAEALDSCASSPDSNCVCPYTYPIVSATDRVTFGSVFKSVLTFGLLPPTIREPDVSWKQRKVSVQLAQGSTPSTTLILTEPNDSQVRSQTIPGIATSVDVPSLSNADVLLAGLGLIEEPATNKFFYSPEFESKTAGIYKVSPNQLMLYADSKDAPSSVECNVFRKFVKFCVKQDATFFAYDAVAGVVGEQQVVAKFAYFFVPPVRDVKSLEVYDAKKAQGAVLLVWDALEGIDVHTYTIYYSLDSAMKASVQGKTVEEIDADSKIRGALTKVEIDTLDAPEILAFDFTQDPQCILSGRTCSVNYVSELLLLPLSLEHNTLYFLSQSDPKKYVYLLDKLEDDVRYFFAITGTDAEGVESKMLAIAPDEKVQVSLDDSAPALVEFSVSGNSSTALLFLITPPTQHIDGSELVDPSEVFQYKLYCFREDESTYDLSAKVPFKTKAAEDTAGAVFEVKTEAVPTSCMQNPETKQSVNPIFVVTAVDQKGNEYRGTLPRSSLQIPKA